MQPLDLLFRIKSHVCLEEMPLFSLGLHLCGKQDMHQGHHHIIHFLTLAHRSILSVVFALLPYLYTSAFFLLLTKQDLYIDGSSQGGP